MLLARCWRCFGDERVARMAAETAHMLQEGLRCVCCKTWAVLQFPASLSQHPTLKRAALGLWGLFVKLAHTFYLGILGSNYRCRQTEDGRDPRTEPRISGHYFLRYCSPWSYLLTCISDTWEILQHVFAAKPEDSPVIPHPSPHRHSTDASGCSPSNTWLPPVMHNATSIVAQRATAKPTWATSMTMPPCRSTCSEETALATAWHAAHKPECLGSCLAV